MNSTQSRIVLSALLTLMLSTVNVSAQQEPQEAALASGKIVWDIALGNTPLEFNQYLDIIIETHKDLVA